MQHKLFLDLIEEAVKFVDLNYDSENALCTVDNKNLGIYILYLQFTSFKEGFIDLCADNQSCDTNIKFNKIRDYLITRTSPELAEMIN